MTREEAIKTLKITHCKGCNDYGDCETCYIGLAIADMEKQIPKAIINQDEFYDYADAVACNVDRLVDVMKEMKEKEN